MDSGVLARSRKSLVVANFGAFIAHHHTTTVRIGSAFAITVSLHYTSRGAANISTAVKRDDVGHASG